MRRPRRRSVWQRASRLCVQWYETLLGWYQLRGCDLGHAVQTNGRLCAEGRRRIRIGSQSRFAGGLMPSRLIAHPGAVLQVGSLCMVNYGVRIESYGRIEIGNRCLFGSAIVICDRDDTGVAPITIEDDVWLAHGVQVRPGVRIGRHAVVAAGAVVTEDIPPEMLAIGSPARTLPLRLLAKPGEQEI